MTHTKNLYSRLALITSVTLVVGYFVVYAAWSSLTVDEVGPGATITTGLMTKIKDNFEDLNTRVSNFTFNAGNVGIGINPVSKLQVSGATTSTVFQIYPISARPSASSPALYQPVDGHLGIATNDAERMRIDANGNVGIGTTTPGTKLEVVGKVYIGGYSIGNGGGDYPAYGYNLDWSAATNSVTGVKYRLSDSATAIREQGNFQFFTAPAGTAGNTMTLTERMRIESNGNVGIGTTAPGTYKLAVVGGPFAVIHNQNTNTPFSVVGKDAQSTSYYLGLMATSNGADNEFLFRADGNAYADSSWNSNGADYAEWFEKEGNIAGGALVGLNTETGKVRTWQMGDIFIGIQSLNPGFVGNNIYGAETSGIDMTKTHVLVALVGQVELNSHDIIENGRRITTIDGQFIGFRLANGNVFIK